MRRFTSLLILSAVFLLPLSCVHFREPVHLDVYRGEPVPFEEMIDSLALARLIYIGEIHTLERHHRFQLRVIQALSQRNIPLAVGLEMLPFTVQSHLDAWTDGRLSEKEFLKLIDWETNWGTDFRLYRPIFEYARSERIPLRALNAPRHLVKEVARKGLAGLSEEHRRMLPPITMSSEEHRRLLELSIGRHKTLRAEMQAAAYEAQDVWDSTMAHEVAEYLNSEAGTGKTMVVLAGTGHMAYGFGIPERVARSCNLPYRIVISSDSGDLEYQKEWERYVEPVDLTHEDFLFLGRPIANFIFLVPLRR
jgi:uncharacterized iron-regulated protein